jgi:hypothetical protein
MKTLRIIASLGILSLFPLIQTYAASSDQGNQDQGNHSDKGDKNKNPADQVAGILAAVPLPELPAKAADLVASSKQKDKEAVALAAIQFTATAHPGSIAAVVGSLAGTIPGSAATIALTAVKLVPGEALGIDTAAIHAAPNQSGKINEALAPFLPSPPRDPGNPNPGSGRRGPPSFDPPGLALGHDKGDHDGSIRGDHPGKPSGHDHEPDQDRDDDRDHGRHHYGSP